MLFSLITATAYYAWAGPGPMNNTKYKKMMAIYDNYIYIYIYINI